ncbi:MAG: hypothetical protein ACYCQI_10955 [Gammaproteobacteria bacterium]
MLSARRAGLISQIKSYIEKRKNEKEYHYCWGAFFGGFRQSDKLQAAEALLDCVVEPRLNPVPKLLQHFEVLHQGRLAEYMSLYKEGDWRKYDKLKKAHDRIIEQEKMSRVKAVN